MGKRVTVTRFDDLEPETEATDTGIIFGLDGNTYEIDLSSKNAAKLRKALEPFIAVATRVAAPAVRRPRPTARRGKSPDSMPLGEIRAWAQENNIPVADRGRVSAEVVRAWKNATQTTDETED